MAVPDSEQERMRQDQTAGGEVLYPAAVVQEQIWFQEQWTPKIGVYNIPTALRLTGELDREALQRGLDALVRRHEALRSRFLGDGTNLSQVVSTGKPVDMGYEDLSELESREREGALRERLRREARKTFDLKRDLLIRAALFKVGKREHVFLVTMHHLASDEWSVRLFLEELKELYTGYSQGREPVLKELPIQYGDFAVWQREGLEGKQARDDLQYWKEELAGELPRLDFPRDRAAGPERSFEGARIGAELGSELTEEINQFARRCGTTPFTVLLAGWQALLARYANQREILTGTAVAGRGLSETEGLIGLFSNLLVIRAKVPEEITFRELAGTVKEKTLNAFTHQETPFDRVVAEIRPDRSSTEGPVIQNVFTVQNELMERDEWAGLQVEWIELETGTSKFDLTATAINSRAGYKVVLEYNTDLFERAGMERFLGHYRSLLRALLAEPERRVWQADFLPEAERKRMLEEWNATRREYPRERTIHELFEEQARRSPEAAALVLGSERWSYAELDQRSSELASTLRALGAGPEVMVGLCMHRSLELVLGMLAILKSGACYVPLDPDYPAERLEFMIQDTKAPLLLTQTTLKEKLPETDARIIAVHETEFAGGGAAPQAERKAGAENAAYVIYTSGSTGRPKGVVVTHRNVARLVQNADYASMGPEERFLQYAPISFDASTFEIWGALLNGGTLCIMPSGKASLEELASSIKEYGITTLWLTTGLFNVMVDEQMAALRPLRQMLTGGEAGSITHLRKFLENTPDCRLIHCYGPTENTTFTTFAELTLDRLSNGLLPIGRPIANTTVYILDQELKPVPIGVAGELYTGGDGVAREYLNAPELTAEKFIPSPFDERERLYRTGDLARFLPDGGVQYLGRLDRQVKIRGFRIELNEIERELSSHPGVEDAVVVAEEKGASERRLIAYWTGGNGKAASEDRLREHLRRALPEFMVPQIFVRMEKLPLDPNGKVDRKALPPPEAELAGREQEYVAPRNELESAVAAIWREALGLRQIGVHDNFFQLGGHSLLATQIISRAKRTLKVEVPLRVIFDSPTVAAFAEAARGHQGKNGGSGPILARKQSREAEELLSRLDELSDEEIAELVKTHSS